MKLFGALAVGVLLTGASVFGAAIIDSTELGTLCTAAGSNCGNVTFNTDDEDISSPLFGPLGIVSTTGSYLTSQPFQGGVPYLQGALGNQGNGYLATGLSSQIDISVDDGSLSALGFTVDQGIYGDGQGMLFEIFFVGGASQVLNTVSQDGCIGGGGAFISCPAFIGVEISGGDNAIEFIRIRSLTAATGPERFNLYNLTYILAGEVPDPDPDPDPIPEPATFGLMGAALLGIGAWRKFRK